MGTAAAPTKDQVRQYLAARRIAHTPPPSIEDIKRQLGWHGDGTDGKGGPVPADADQ